MKKNYLGNIFSRLTTLVDKHKLSFISLFFSCYLILGLVIVNDYGISWDEPTERFTSIAQYKFAISKLFFMMGYESPLLGEHMFNYQMLHTNRDRYYGTFLHWPLVALEHASGFTIDSQEVYLMRHIHTFLFFYLASICLFLILSKRYKDWKSGILGVLFLVLTPRFFAESFYNNKDILFTAVYVISIFFALWYLEKPNLLKAAIVGVIIGLAINTRIVAGILLLLIGLWELVALTSEFKPARVKQTFLRILYLSMIALISYCTYIVSIPTAWGNEVRFLAEVFDQFSQFTWNGKTLYFGQYVPWDNIPWHYVPGYMWATTPLWNTSLAAMGMLLLVVEFVKKIKMKSSFWQTAFWKTDLFIVATGLVPWLMIIVLKSNMYNGWRHTYFLYITIIYFMIFAIQQAGKWRNILVGISLVSLLANGAWMIRQHPYQFLYFNPLVRSSANQLFERDYWGVVTMDFMKHILATDNRPIIHIYQHDFTYKAIDLMLNKEDKLRFRFVENQNDADYMTHLFYNTTDDTWEQPGFVEIKRVEVDGVVAQILFKNVQKQNSSP